MAITRSVFEIEREVVMKQRKYDAINLFNQKFQRANIHPPAKTEECNAMVHFVVYISLVAIDVDICSHPPDSHPVCSRIL